MAKGLNYERRMRLASRFSKPAPKHIPKSMSYNRFGVPKEDRETDIPTKIFSGAAKALLPAPAMIKQAVQDPSGTIRGGAELASLGNPVANTNRGINLLRGKGFSIFGADMSEAEQAAEMLALYPGGKAVSAPLKAATKVVTNPMVRAGITSGAKAVGPSLGRGPTSGGFGELFEGVSEAAGAGVRRAARKTSAVERDVEKALANPAGGAVTGLSKLATNLVALGFPLDRETVKQFDSASLQLLGASKNLAFTGPYSIRAKLEPAAKDLETRVSGLLGGTKKRLSRVEVPELFDPKTNLDDLSQNTEEVTGNAGKLLERLLVPVDESMSALDALAGKPTHLIDDWQKFRADNPNVPFSLIRQAPNARGYFAMGPAGEHPFSVGGAERIGNISRWTDVPDLNSLMFWLHSLPNIKKGGQNPVSWIPEFQKMFPAIADIVMPKGGYVDKAYDRAIQDMKSLNPDFLEGINKINLDQIIRDMGKFG